jgi:outer membrane receptor protein involved in Fe transport
MSSLPLSASSVARVASALLSVALLPVPAAAQDRERSASVAALDEVVVTARKREESLQDVPISIEAISGEALANQGIRDTAGLIGRVAGLSIQDGGPGYRGVYVRGVASERGNAPTTAFYIDESYVPAGAIVQSIVEPLYFDVERVEVLRGPQGTVVGGSSLGGAVQIINNAPDLARFSSAVGAELSSTTDGGMNYQMSGILNIPLAVDRAALRVAGSWRDRDGFIDRLVGPLNLQRQFTGASRRLEDVNGDQSRSARVALTWQATDALAIKPSFFLQRTEVDNFGSFDRPGSTVEQRRYFDVQEPVYDEARIGNLTVTYDFANAQLLSSSSRSVRKASFSEDGTDYLAEQFFRGVYLPNTFSPNYRETLFTQELRLVSRGEGRLSGVAGAYLEKFDRDVESIWVVPNLNATVPGSALFCPNNTCFNQVSDFDREQRALFGELNLRLTDRWTLTGGLRWYEFDIDSATVGAAPTSATEDGVSPRVSLSFKPGANSTLYATYSEGFRPGGPNRLLPAARIAPCQAQYAQAGITIPASGQIPPYESDALENYELGAKLRWADGRITTNAAVYRIDWVDIQQLYFPPFPCGFGSNQNFGKAKIQGVELDFNARPTETVSLFGGLNYNDAQIDEDVPALGVRQGLQIQNAPEWSGNVNLQVDFAGLGSPQAFAILTVRYTDDSLRDFEVSNPAKLQDSYTLVNARVGTTLAGWNVALFVDNLTNDDPGVMNFLSSFGPVPSRERMFAIQPRTFGISVRKNFQSEE